MASDRVVAEVVARVYTAAGRSSGPTECRLFEEQFGGDDVADDELVAASHQLVAGEDWSRRPPSVALLWEWLRIVRAGASARALPAAPVPPVSPAEWARHWPKVRAASGHPRRRGHAAPAKPDPSDEPGYPGGVDHRPQER